MAKTTGIYPVKDRDGKPMKNKWRVCATLKHPETGKSVPKAAICNGNKEAAKELQADMKANPAKYLCPDEPDETTLDAFAREWLDRMRKKSRRTGKPSPRRVGDLEAYLKPWLEHLGGKRLEEISARTVRRTLDAIEDDKERASGRPVSGKTMNKVFGAFNQVMKAAYFDELVQFNPCDRVETPSASGESDRRSLEREEAYSLVDALDKSIGEALAGFWAKEERLKEWGHANKARAGMKGIINASWPIGVELALFHGLRRGEILGLRWNDIDLHAGTMLVQHSLTDKMELRGTKTGNKETLYLESGLRGWLDELHALQTYSLRALGFLGDDEPLPGDRFVICNNNIEATSPRNFSRWFDSWKAGTDGVPDDIRLQELRTTNGTFLAAELPQADTARALRHSNPRTTQTYYQKPLHENDRKQAEIMGRLRRKERPGFQVFERKTG